MRALVFAVVLLLACNPVKSPLDAASADVCESYCECMVVTCGETDPAQCIRGCVELAGDVRGCRSTHCGLAEISAEQQNEADVELHCGHARGVGLCQGVN